MNVIAKISRYFSAVSLHWNCAKISKYSDIQYTSLTLDRRTEQYDTYNVILCQHILSYKLLKQSGFWPTLYIPDYRYLHILAD